MGLTNLATFYLYAQEKIKLRRANTAAYQAMDRIRTDAVDHVVAFRQEAQQRYLETWNGLKTDLTGAEHQKQQLAAALKIRNQKLQRFYGDRNAGVGEALKIIQEDGNLLVAYNEYFRQQEERQQGFIERFKPLGESLGVQALEPSSKR